MMPTRQKHNSDQTKEATHKRRTVKPIQRETASLTQRADLAVLQRAVVDPSKARQADILALQRAYGNRAVTRLIQTKLTVGPVGDRYEREADRVAERVMGMTVPVRERGRGGEGETALRRQVEEEELQMQPLAASITPLVQRQGERGFRDINGSEDIAQRQAEEEEEELQMKPVIQRQTEEEEELQMKPVVQRQAEGGFQASPGLERQLAAQKGSGSPLPADARAFMEPRFGADFGGVRVHTDGEAVQMNRELKSHAFTHGQDIYFGAGKYNPGSEGGKRLLAHELTHTIQQGTERRISRWFAAGHKLVTLEALNRIPNREEKFSDRVQEDIVDKSGSLDYRAKPIASIVFGTVGGWLKKGAVWAGKLLMGRSVRRKWERDLFKANAFHMRTKSELPNHGEAGAYRRRGKENQNIAQVNEHINTAVAAANKDNLGKATKYLAYALHAAEDRGSHGEGNPGTGHDPRCVVPPREAPGGKNKWFRSKNWDPDDLGINSEGKNLAIGYAVGVLNRFHGQLSHRGKELIKYEFGSSFELEPELEKRRTKLAKKLLKREGRK